MIENVVVNEVSNANSLTVGKRKDFMWQYTATNENGGTRRKWNDQTEMGNVQFATVVIPDG